MEIVPASSGQASAVVGDIGLRHSDHARRGASALERRAGIVNERAALHICMTGVRCCDEDPGAIRRDQRFSDDAVNASARSRGDGNGISAVVFHSRPIDGQSTYSEAA